MTARPFTFPIRLPTASATHFCRGGSTDPEDTAHCGQTVYKVEANDREKSPSVTRRNRRVLELELFSTFAEWDDQHFVHAHTIHVDDFDAIALEVEMLSHRRHPLHPRKHEPGHGFEVLFCWQ